MRIIGLIGSTIIAAVTIIPSLLLFVWAEDGSTTQYIGVLAYGIACWFAARSATKFFIWFESKLK